MSEFDIIPDPDLSTMCRLRRPDGNLSERVGLAWATDWLHHAERAAEKAGKASAKAEGIRANTERMIARARKAIANSQKAAAKADADAKRAQLNAESARRTLIEIAWRKVPSTAPANETTAPQEAS